MVEIKHKDGYVNDCRIVHPEGQSETTFWGLCWFCGDEDRGLEGGEEGRGYDPLVHGYVHQSVEVVLCLGVRNVDHMAP